MWTRDMTKNTIGSRSHYHWLPDMDQLRLVHGWPMAHCGLRVIPRIPCTNDEIFEIEVRQGWPQLGYNLCPECAQGQLGLGKNLNGLLEKQ